MSCFISSLIYSAAHGVFLGCIDGLGYLLFSFQNFSSTSVYKNVYATFKNVIDEMEKILIDQSK